MPYIPQDHRKPLEKPIRDLIFALGAHIPPESADGALNYVITRLLLGLYVPRYASFNRALGVLSAVTQEYYRVVVGPYEDKKREENGDIC